MCGIAGIAGSGVARYREAARAMARALAHRGPDESGSYESEGCVLEHVRLSIVDLKTGRQPMTAPASGLTVAFNGEIYGFRDLKAGLAPFPFRTDSDTEVLLALFERDGVRALESLPGMFAFGLWDPRKRELLLARDRFGEKPLYYAALPDGTLLFASEIKGLLASGLVSPDLRREALAGFLRRGYVPPRTTIHRGIEVLPPAHRLRFADGRIEVRRYWSPPRAGGDSTLEDARDRFTSLFERAVSRQLVADAPLGILLSGGLDSTSVTAVAARLRPGIRTFCFGVEGGASELRFAREAAAKFGTDHTEVEDLALDLPALLHRMTAVHDEPFADSSAIPTYVIAGAAREHVKVALGGDGGDELLAGYWYMPPLRDMEVEPSAPLWRWHLTRALHHLARGDRRTALAHRIRGLEMRRGHGSVLDALDARHRVLQDAEIGRLGLPLPAQDGPPREGDLEAAIRDDVEDYLPGSILVKTDRASMAHGLELRAPFLDVDLATFLLGLPWHLKIGAGESKILLRRAFEDRWPASVEGRAKQGFGAPVAEWLHRPDVAPLLRATLEDPGTPLAALLPREEVATLAAGSPERAWLFLVLGLWLGSRGAAPRA
jgi:asparagine synthase (glutamine-hydrolysing)